MMVLRTDGECFAITLSLYTNSEGEGMDNNWYLAEYKNKIYLHNKLLSLKAFNTINQNHDHCELCWARFSNHSNDLQNGYYEPLSRSWICPDCYNELATLFGWTVIDGQEHGNDSVNP